MYDYQLTTLPNGVRIASERMPGVRSAALGIWVTTGSREEKASESGAAHFIEHMLFKGTPSCSAEELARRDGRHRGPDQRLYHQGEHLLPRSVPGHPSAGGPGHPL